MEPLILFVGMVIGIAITLVVEHVYEEGRKDATKQTKPEV